MQTRIRMAGAAAVALVASGVIATSAHLHATAAAWDTRPDPAAPQAAAPRDRTEAAPAPSTIDTDVRRAVEEALEQAGVGGGRIDIDIQRIVADATRSAQEAVKNLDVQVVVDDAIEGLGEVGGEGRLRIGIRARDVTADEARTAGLSGITGAFAMEVPADSAAAKGGLQANDIILTIDGETVRSTRQLARLIAESPEGKALPVGYVRGTTRGTATVTPERPAPRRMMTMRDTGEGPTVRRFERRFVPMPDGMSPGGSPDVEVFERRLPPPGGPAEEGRELLFRQMPGGTMRVYTGRGRLGVMVQQLTPQLATYFGARAGVLVAEVHENTPAAKAGVRSGDVITSVNGTPVQDVDDIMQSLEGVADGKAVPVEIVRDKKPQTIQVTLQAPAASSGERSATRTRRFTA